MLKIHNIFFILFSFHSACFAQIDIPDSLTSDSAKVYWLKDESYKYQANNIAKAQKYGEEALKIARLSNSKKLLLHALFNLSNICIDQADYVNSLKYLLECLKISEEIKNHNATATALNGIGNIYSLQSEREKGLVYYKKALNYYEKTGNKIRMATLYNNIGNVYYYLEYDGKEFKNTLEYYSKAEKIKAELKDTAGHIEIFSNIGLVYGDMQQFDKAKIFLLKAIELCDKINDISLKAGVLTNLARAYGISGKNEKALEHFSQALSLAKEMGDKNLEAYIYADIADSYYQLGKYQEAYDFYYKYSNAKDSILNTENSHILAKMQTQYDLDKKEKEIELLRQKNEIQLLESNKEKTFRNILILGSALGLLLTFLLYNRYRIKIKTNKDLQLAYDIIEEKNRDILDSINYAKGMQHAILPSPDTLKNLFPDAYIFFKPKDLVSGDFYWFSEKNNKIIVAAADCTGHGVPGALMSMIGNTLLNEIVNEKGITQPSEILFALREGIIKILNQTNSQREYADGMDIALCSVDKDLKSLEYSGANNPLWIVSGKETNSKSGTANPERLREVKPDKQPIGIYQGQGVPFSNHKIDLETGDMIYLFSDGYADQFGGKGGKKFKNKQLKEMLHNISDLPAYQQDKIMEDTLFTWKGNLEQVDDILVIGIRV